MTQTAMYPGVARSPITTLVDGIDADDLEIVVASVAGLPAFPNYLVIGDNEADTDGETVLVASADGTTLTLTSRGDNAAVHASGSVVWRPLVLEDLTSLQDNVEDHETRIGTLESTGGGDVDGPATATDNAIARFDLTTGKILQNSLATVDDSGSVNIPSGQAYKIGGTALTASDVGASASDHNHDAAYVSVVGSPTEGNLAALTAGGEIADSGVAPASLAAKWTQTTGTFTATPASTSTITMTSDLTATIKPGYPLKYAIGGTTYYGICTAIASNLLTVAGAPLSGDIAALYYGDPARAVQLPILIPGYYEDASTTRTSLADDLGQSLVWQQAPAYLVRVNACSRVADGSSNGTVNVGINGADVLSTAITLANTSWTPSVVAVATANYDINFGEVIEVSAGKGTGGDAQDLSMVLTFVFP